jgi:hypothetical protein
LSAGKLSSGNLSAGKVADYLAPAPAERARTIAARSSRAFLKSTRYHGRWADFSSEKGRAEQNQELAKQRTDQEQAAAPLLHHVHESGSVSVLLPQEHHFAIAARQNSDLEVILEVIDQAPLALREPTRGLLWITGWLRPLDKVVARARAVAIAEQRPDHRLLDLGHGADLFRLTPTCLVLADSEGTHSLRPHHFSAALIDPFCDYERQWLPHLENRHADALAQLAKHAPAAVRHGHVRPLGLDRCGLRLRVEADDGDHDVRVPFSHPVDCLPQLAQELRKLIEGPAVHPDQAHQALRTEH